VIAGTRFQERRPAGNYFLPRDVQEQLATLIKHYNQHRYHESLSNMPPTGAYSGRAEVVIKQRERIKWKTIEHPRLLHRKIAT